MLMEQRLIGLVVHIVKYFRESFLFFLVQLTLVVIEHVHDIEFQADTRFEHLVEVIGDDCSPAGLVLDIPTVADGYVVGLVNLAGDTFRLAYAVIPDQMAPVATLMDEYGHILAGIKLDRLFYGIDLCGFFRTADSVEHRPVTGGIRKIRFGAGSDGHVKTQDAVDIILQFLHQLTPKPALTFVVAQQGIFPEARADLDDFRFFLFIGH